MSRQPLILGFVCRRRRSSAFVEKLGTIPRQVVAWIAGSIAG